MLTRLIIRNFKLFEEVEIELGERVVFIGPNNSGKTSALQAIALWDVGVKRWLEKRGSENIPTERAGVTINRQDLIAIPVPSAKLLWRDLHVCEGERMKGRTRTRHVRIEIGVEGVNNKVWQCRLEFDYANEESIYCRPPLGPDGRRMSVPAHLRNLEVAYLPPMSGLTARKDRLEIGSIRVRLGEGRTAEVLRNLCWQVLQSENGEQKWEQICTFIERLFGSKLNRPRYIAKRGEIVMDYRTSANTLLDISASERGEQQTLLLLAHMAIHSGAVLLLDEPDAHLEILRQRQIYEVLSRQAEQTNTQLIAASHSEVVLNEAAERDMVVAFVGTPHRIDDRGSQTLKALRDIGFENYYYLAEEVGWVLYLEGSTDLAMLRAFASVLDHQASKFLERPFVHYVGNQPQKAQEHFHALREAKPDLVGIAIYDRLDKALPESPYLKQKMWKRRELENYLCHREALLRFAEEEGNKHAELFRVSWRAVMEEVIAQVEDALRTLGKDPWSADVKASGEFLDPLFKQFYAKLNLPNRMEKNSYHALATFLSREEIVPEIAGVLNDIAEVAKLAKPRENV